MASKRTINISTDGKSFTVTNSSGSIYYEGSVGNIEIQYTTNGYFSMLNASKGNFIIQNSYYGDVINGATTQPFASISALQTYFQTNFFNEASGGAGETTPVDSTQFAIDSITGIMTITPAAVTNILKSLSGYVGDGSKVLADNMTWVTQSTASQLTTPTLTIGTITSTSVALSSSAPANETGYVFEMSTSSTFSSGNTTVYTGASNTATAQSLNPSTVYYFRVKATAQGYTTSAYSTIQTATTSAGSGSSITSLTFASLSSGVVYNSTGNTYKPTYVDSESWGNGVWGAGKKLAAGSNGAVYLKADGVTQEVALGFVTADAETYYQNMVVGFQFNQLAFPDINSIEAGAVTNRGSFATNTDYRIFKTFVSTGVALYKLQSSTDNWTTPVDVYTYAYTTDVDMYPVGDTKTESTNLPVMDNPRGSGLV